MGFSSNALKAVGTASMIAVEEVAIKPLGKSLKRAKAEREKARKKEQIKERYDHIQSEKKKNEKGKETESLQTTQTSHKQWRRSEIKNKKVKKTNYTGFGKYTNIQQRRMGKNEG